MKNALFFACFFFLAVPLLKADLKIDPAKAVISVTDAKENKTAADELKKHLDLISSADIPIVSENKIAPDSFVFYVGKVPDGVKADFKPGEARWAVTPAAAYFFGDKRSGTQNAVYDFLEKEMGIRWPAPGDTAFKRTPLLNLKTASGSWTPALKIAVIRGSGAEYRQWAGRMRLGTYGDVPRYGHAFMTWWDKYGKTHPEYFALNSLGTRAPAPRANDDKSNPAAYQGKTAYAIKMCVSSPALRKQILENWNPRKEQYINLCENDSPPTEYCRCEACRALDATKPGENFEEHLTDRYISFADKVAEEAVKLRPDARVALYAYNETEHIPRKTKIAENVTIGIVPTVFDVESTRALLESWKSQGLSELFWRPNLHYYFCTAQIPFGFEKHFFTLQQIAKSHNAVGFDYDSANSHKGATTEFADYVLVKSMQDLEKPFEYWEKHYLESFGNASAEVGEYYLYWRTLFDSRISPKLKEILLKGKWFNFARGMMWNLGDYYREGDFDATDKILEKASKKQLSAEEKARVDKLILANRHARLIYRATVLKKDEDSIALLQFRNQNKLEEFPETEKNWGDVTGVIKAAAFREFTPPYIGTQIFWFFKLDPENVGLKEEWFKDDFKKICAWGERMPINNFWETPHKHYKYPSDAMRKKTEKYDGVAWYAYPLSGIPKDWKDRDVYLYFGAVDESCHVYVNGKEAGKHLFVKSDDWNTPFSIKINDFIRWDTGTQIVIVRVEDKGGMGGIWKPVWVVSKVRR